jgi:branched-chain amino acid transport system ATP-binding protein
MTGTPPVLELRDVKAGYGKVQALHGISLQVRPGEVIALIGANGAGKSTTLRAISGLIAPTGGDILLDGSSIARRRPDLIVRSGIAHCPEERRVWPELSVQENLSLGAYICSDRAEVKRRTEMVLARFPRLRERSAQFAGTLSGGEQQMLAIGRALMGRPSLLMLDEPSLGLAPIVIEQVFDRIVELNKRTGLGVLLVEQNSAMALEIANRASVLETGIVTLSGPSSVLADDPRIREAYLGG